MGQKKKLFFIFCLFITILCFPAFAVKIQILHTNDLHSYLENIGSDVHHGGYAAIKAIFDDYKAWGKKNGIETFIFDGGDFLEGNLYYKAMNGIKSMEAMEMMGFDAIALGNHDFLMGTEDLDRLLGETNTKAPILSANFFMPEKYKNIYQHIKPYKNFSVENVKFSVFGLTTDSKLYSWRVSDGLIDSPYKVGRKIAKKLKRENDFVFALTHIGFSEDKILASLSGDIDLIVGGHSHTLLEQPDYVFNYKGKFVPIVQTGAHGEKVGRMILDLTKGKHLKVLSYELIDVTQSKEDQKISELVNEAKSLINEKYGKNWLNEVIGFSKIPLTHSKWGTTFWGDFISEATREIVDAEIGIHTVGFIGHDLNPGPITRENIIDVYPRFFEFDHDYGWNIYLAKIKGTILKLALEIIINSGAPVNISGMKFDLIKKSGEYVIENIKIQNRDVDLSKTYSVAIPEGIARGGPSLTPLYPIILNETEDTGFTLWQAIENKIKKTGTIERRHLELRIPHMRINLNKNT